MLKNKHRKGYVLFEAMIGLSLATGVVIVLSIVIGTITREQIDRAYTLDRYAETLMEIRAKNYFTRRMDDVELAQKPNENTQKEEIDLKKYQVKEIQNTTQVSVTKQQYQMNIPVPSTVVVDSAKQEVIAIESITYQTSSLYAD